MIRRHALRRPESTTGGMVAGVTVTPTSLVSHQRWLFLNKAQGKLGKERCGKAVEWPGAEELKELMPRVSKDLLWLAAPSRVLQGVDKMQEPISS